MGGLPVGRLAEIAGPPGIGKTSLALGLCSATQRRGGIAAVIDADGGLERTTLSRCGVDPKSLVIARPDSGEHALQIVDELLRAKAADLIVGGDCTCARGVAARGSGHLLVDGSLASAYLNGVVGRVRGVGEHAHRAGVLRERGQRGERLVARHDAAHRGTARRRRRRRGGQCRPSRAPR